jgi:hypothetical protein
LNPRFGDERRIELGEERLGFGHTMDGLRAELHHDVVGKHLETRSFGHVERVDGLEKVQHPGWRIDFLQAVGHRLPSLEPFARRASCNAARHDICA